MPRISYCTNYEDRDKPGFSGENENLDFCRRCWRHRFERVPQKLIGTGAIDDDADRPEYEGDHFCDRCGKQLAEEATLRRMTDKRRPA